MNVNLKARNFDYQQNEKQQDDERIIHKTQFHFLIEHKKGSNYIVESRNEVSCRNRIFQSYKKEETEYLTLNSTTEYYHPIHKLNKHRHSNRRNHNTHTTKHRNQQQLYRHGTKYNEDQTRRTSPRDMEMKTLLTQYERWRRKYWWGAQATRRSTTDGT